MDRKMNLQLKSLLQLILRLFIQLPLYVNFTYKTYASWIIKVDPYVIVDKATFINYHYSKGVYCNMNENGKSEECYYWQVYYFHKTLCRWLIMYFLRSLDLHPFVCGHTYAILGGPRHASYYTSCKCVNKGWRFLDIIINSISRMILFYKCKIYVAKLQYFFLLS